MLALLVWLAGVAFGLWSIWHFGFYREAMAFAVCTSVFFWIVGGATWISQKLQVGAAARAASAPRGLPGLSLPLSDKDRDALKRAAASQSSE